MVSECKWPVSNQLSASEFNKSNHNENGFEVCGASMHE